MFDLVIFDCDGVLVDSETLAGEALRSVYAGHGIEVTAELFASVVGMKTADGLEAIERATGRPLPESAEAQFWPATERLFREGLRPSAGVEDLLRRSALPRCVASSSRPERIRLSLEVTGLAGFFEPGAVFSSLEVPRGKPAPDLFLHAAARMEADPRACLVIEDTRYGIMGAKAAGMTAFGYVGGSHQGAEAAERLMAAGADFVARTMDEIAARLAVRR